MQLPAVLVVQALAPVVLLGAVAALLGAALLGRPAGGLSGRPGRLGGSTSTDSGWLLLAEPLLAGLVALSFVLVFLSLCGGFRLRVLLPLLALIVVWSVRGLRRETLRGEHAERESRSATRCDSRSGRWRGWRPTAAAVLGATAVPMVLLALWPAHGFDSLNYHLPFAEAFAREGRLVALDALRFPAFPPLGELFQALVMLVGGDAAAKAVALLPTVATAGLCFAWGRLLGVPLAGGLAAALWLGQPLVIWLSGQAYVEPWVALFTTGGLYSVDKVCRGAGRDTLILAGASLAAACATKYLGLVALAIAVCWLLLADSAALRRRVARAACLVAVAALLVVPIYGWIAFETGNPVFPYFESVFGSAGEWSTESKAGTGAQELWWQKGMWLLLLPWSTGFARQQFHYSAVLSPLWVPLCLITLWQARRIPALRFPLFAAVAFAASLLVHQERRLHHLLPSAAWLSVAAGGALAAALSRKREAVRALGSSAASGGGWLRHLFARGVPATAAFVLLISPGLAYGWFKVASGGLPPLAASARQQWLAERVPGYGAVAALRRECGESSRSAGATASALPEAEPDCVIYLWQFHQLRHDLPARVIGDVYGPFRQDKLQRVQRRPLRLQEQLSQWSVTHLVLSRPRAEVILRQMGAERIFEPLWQDAEVSVLRCLGPATATDAAAAGWNVQ